MAERRSIENQLLLTGTSNTLLSAVSSATTITSKSIMLMIKRRNSLVKQSEAILYDNKTNVCFKRIKRLEER